MKIKKQNHDTLEKNTEIRYKKKDKIKQKNMKVSGSSVKKLHSIISKK